MSSGRVLFVGCGPGAADLLTLRAVAALAAADVVIWSAGLIGRDAIAAHTRAGCEIVAWPPATQREIDAVYDRAGAEGLVVVRLKGGDPMVLGELARDARIARARGLQCEFVPGITAFSAAAAALGDSSAADAPILLARESDLAGGRAGYAVAVHGAGRDPRALQRALLARGMSPATDCVVAIEVSRPEELLLSCPLDELAETLEDMARGRLVLVIATTPTTGTEGSRAAERGRSEN